MKAPSAHGPGETILKITQPATCETVDHVSIASHNINLLSVDHNQRPCPLLPSAKYHSQFVDRLQSLVLHPLAQILMILASNYPLCRATSPTKIAPTAARLAVPFLAALRGGAPTIAPIPVMRKTVNLRMNL